MKKMGSRARVAEGRPLGINCGDTSSIREAVKDLDHKVGRCPHSNSKEGLCWHSSISFLQAGCEVGVAQRAYFVVIEDEVFQQVCGHNHAYPTVRPLFSRKGRCELELQI